MKRSFTKYPSNKVYATKAYTKGYVVSEPILVSSKDVFLDMGIDYDSYVQQDADSYL